MTYNKLSDEEFEIFKQKMIEELVILHYFNSEIIDDKDFISITTSGISYLEDLIEKISKLILKEKPYWLNLLSLDELFLIQTELMKTIFAKPEFALLHLATEYKLDNLEVLAKDYIKLIEPDLIELSPKSTTVH